MLFNIFYRQACLCYLKSYMKYIPSLFLLLIAFSSQAQDENLRYEDYVYKENIHTVQFHIEGLVLSYPLVDLNSRARMLLSFDDFDEEVKDYTFEIVHCNADWQPSDCLLYTSPSPRDS